VSFAERLQELRGSGRSYSDSASDDEDDGGEWEPAPRRRGRRSDDRIAHILYRRMRQGGHRKVLDHVRAVDFKNSRSRHECRRSAQAIDAFLAAGIPLEETGMEILFRTVAGLMLSDEYGDPTLLEEMEWAPPEAIVPRDILRTVMKDARRRRGLAPKVRVDAPREKADAPKEEAWPAPAATPAKGGGRGAGRA